MDFNKLQQTALFLVLVFLSLITKNRLGLRSRACRSPLPLPTTLCGYLRLYLIIITPNYMNVRYTLYGI